MGKLKIVVLGILSLSIFLFSESNAQIKFTKEQKALKKEADYYYGFAAYPKAKKIYLDLLKVDSINAEINYKVGVCILIAENDKVTSAPYFEHASSYGFVEAHYYLGNVYHLQNKFDLAVRFYSMYMNADIKKKKVENKEVALKIQTSLRAKKMIANPVDVEIENLGPSINTKYHEYVPIISADESVLIFTSRREGSTGGKLDPYGRFYEDIYISYKEEGKWTSPKGIGPNINTDNYDAGVGLSSDGYTLVVYKTNKSLTGGNLYWSGLEGDEWQEPIKYSDKINSSYVESSASLSADGNKIYFASNRPNGLGGRDIYRCVRFPNGEWSLPINLGPTINTQYDDDAPFIHPDDKTLYYSSKGHNTMGGYDIFKSTLQDDRTWSAPENMGYPINTSGDDRYFVLSADGKRGYYSSEKKDGFGDQDLYVIHFPDDTKDLTLIRGIVTADSSGVPLKARITIRNYETKKMEALHKSNSATGRFLLIIPPGKKLKMTVDVPGYEGYQEVLHYDKNKGFEILEKSIVLKPLK
ncbi:MAG: PD40 domain-containing protein [Flavobacteriales bacterium]|nr:PD40 domain-containing protein [Flavobacteriales bacterium]